MTTIGELVDRTINRYLLGTYRARYNQLQGDIDETATELVLSHALDQIGDGSFLALGDELVYVIAVNSGTRLVTCVRGMRGTTAAAHTAGDAVEVNPRHPRFLVREAIQETINGWPDAVYRTEVFETSVGALDREIDALDVSGRDDVITVLRLWRQAGTSHTTWARMPFHHEFDLTEPGSLHIFTHEPWSTAQTYRLLVARRFLATDLADVDELDTLGIPNTFEEPICLGAASRLVLGKETMRLDTNAAGQSRTADQVREQANAQLAARFLALHDKRIADEATRLVHRYGILGN